jgi:hypothetical protein
MPKKCNAENCKYNANAKGYCWNHQYMRTDKKENKSSPSRLIVKNLRAAVSVTVKKVASIHDKLVTTHSIFIRRRFADSRGWVKCFTCPKSGHWKTMHCGHWKKRGNMATKFSEINCQVQCPDCNGPHDGRPETFEINLRAKYGDEAVDQIEREFRTVCHWSDSTMKEKLQYFLNLINQLN